ncbi:NIL domain-containing protein [Pseudanabaena sp. PCC 6802]|uniref:NIL domain-containing protein n=1 Tax=Pseudanabaena sp. PCC 6802 TaxID=118173 RepID=UPI000345207F|nr:NIL domain-containing protein [Pseudanabaena sp. PCC 6802]
MFAETQYNCSFSGYGSEDAIANSSDVDSDDTRPTRANITVRIAKDYHQEPVISHLISKYGVTVNITAALLGENKQEDGWFNLELQGTNRQIRSALNYLNELDVEFWHQNTSDRHEGW